MENDSDYELIQAYLKDANQAAFEILLKRYFEHTKKILFSSGLPAQEVEDVCQKVWIKIVRALPNYKDEGKFGALVTTAAKNLCKDYWRANKNAGQYHSIDDDEQPVFDKAMIANKRTARDYQNAEAISLLTSQLIPALNTELRTVFLLKHEAEYWDNKRPLSWDDLAKLFGMSREKVVAQFVSARDVLIQNHHEESGVSQANCNTLELEALAVFLIWTQSQRDSKQVKQTEVRLAALMGIPLNTFKTRYKRARETLAAGLEAY